VSRFLFTSRFSLASFPPRSACFTFTSVTFCIRNKINELIILISDGIYQSCHAPHPVSVVVRNITPSDINESFDVNSSALKCEQRSMLNLLFRVCSMPVVLVCWKDLLFLSGMRAGGGKPCLPREALRPHEKVCGLQDVRSSLSQITVVSYNVKSPHRQISVHRN
jgi:hypothetical protein